MPWLRRLWNIFNKLSQSDRWVASPLCTASPVLRWDLWWTHSALNAVLNLCVLVMFFKHAVVTPTPARRGSAETSQISRPNMCHLNSPTALHKQTIATCTTSVTTSVVTPAPVDSSNEHWNLTVKMLQIYPISPVKPHLHDTTCCQTGCQSGMTTGCIVYTNIQPVVKPIWQPVSQPAVSCIQPVVIPVVQPIDNRLYCVNRVLQRRGSYTAISKDITIGIGATLYVKVVTCTATFECGGNYHYHILRYNLKIFEPGKWQLLSPPVTISRPNSA